MDDEEKYPLGKENYSDDEKIIAEKNYLDKLYHIINYLQPAKY